MSEIIKQLGLNTTEESIYLLLLSSGQLSAAEIAHQIESRIAEVDTVVNKLIEKNLVYTNPGIVKKYSAIYPLFSLSEKAQETLKTIQNISNEINTYATERFDSLDKIVNTQKENMNKIVSEAKEQNRITNESAITEITSEIDKLIEEISLILNTEKRTISELASTTATEISKQHQETTEKAGNTISKSVSDIANSLNESSVKITKALDESCAKVDSAVNVMHDSMQASLDNNLNDYLGIITDVQLKIKKALEDYTTSSTNNLAQTRQTVNDNYNGIIEVVNTRLGLHDKQTNQILSERIRIINDTLNSMSDEFSRLMKEKLVGIRREYNQLTEQFTKSVERLFTESNTQLESLIASKTKTNAQSLDNLFKLLKENLEKNASDTVQEIRGKQNRIQTELKAVEDASNRKMKEMGEKLTIETTNNFNKVELISKKLKQILAILLPEQKQILPHSIWMLEKMLKKALKKNLKILRILLLQ